MAMKNMNINMQEIEKIMLNYIMLLVNWKRRNLLCGMLSIKKIKEITLFYDYQGIEAWAMGDWQAKLPYTQDYVSFYNKVKTAVKVNFVKVKAHAGIELNELVDSLAKDAIEQFKEKMDP